MAKQMIKRRIILSIISLLITIEAIQGIRTNQSKQYESQQLAQEQQVLENLELSFPGDANNDQPPQSKSLLQTQTIQEQQLIETVKEQTQVKSQTSAQILQAANSYNSNQIRSVIDNLEFLTHKPTSEAQQQINEENEFKKARIDKMKGFVSLVNENLQSCTQISIEGLIDNPKLVSFKLMKLDMEQSCRSQCEVEKAYADPHSFIQVIANSTDQLHVQNLQTLKVDDKKVLPSGIAGDAYEMNVQLKSQNKLQLAQRNADKASLMKEIAFLQTAADNFEKNKLSKNEIQLIQLQSLILNTPNDDMNLQSNQSMQFDFLEHFKSLGNAIMSLFKSNKSTEAPKSSETPSEDDDEGSITIEDSQEKKKSQQSPDDSQNIQQNQKMQNNQSDHKQGKQSQNLNKNAKKSEKEILEERKSEILAKLVRPMGNPAELEKILAQQLEQMNGAKKDSIILSSEAPPSNDVNLQQSQKIEIEQQKNTAPPQLFFQVKKSCPFEKCGIKDLKSKKWASVEDAGILLCTKSPQNVDCLKYNTEYRKLLKLKEDLQDEGVHVDL